MSAVPIGALRVQPAPTDSVEEWCARADVELAEIVLDLALDEVLLRHASAARSRPLPASLREFLSV